MLIDGASVWNIEEGERGKEKDGMTYLGSGWVRMNDGYGSDLVIEHEFLLIVFDDEICFSGVHHY